MTFIFLEEVVFANGFLYKIEFLDESFERL
jgi:hypothetical protein